MIDASSHQEERPDAAAGLAQRASIVIDPRLASVWQTLWGMTGAYPGETLDPLGDRCQAIDDVVLGVVLRMAYLQGYADARAEPTAELFDELGVRETAVSSTPRRGRRPHPGRAPRDSSGR